MAHAQEVLQGPGGLKGSKKREQQDWLSLGGALASLIRRVLLATDCVFCPPDWLGLLYAAMFSDSTDASRSALAALAGLAARREDARTEIAILLTTNKRLVTSTDGLPDTQQALYYLRFCASIAGLDSQVVEPFVRVLLQSVHDKRLRVWLEAVQLLYDRGGAASGPFNRLMDTTGVRRLLSMALQQEHAASAPAVVAILRAIRTLAKWLHEAPAAGNLESIGQQPAAGPLLAAVLGKAASLPSVASAARLGSLLALVWLLPSPGSSPAEWASLEAQVINGAATLTDRQLTEVLRELLMRFQASRDAREKASLARTLLGLVRTVVGAFPSDAMTGATLEVWQALWAAAEEERRARTGSGALAMLLSVTDAAEPPPSLAQLLFACAMAVLDDLMSGTGQQQHQQQRVPRRLPRVWQAPSPGEERAARLRFCRQALRVLSRWAATADDNLAGVMLLRLQNSALYGDALTRGVALGSLCGLAVSTASPDVKMAAYEFLFSLEGEPPVGATLAYLEEALKRGAAVGLSVPGLGAGTAGPEKVPARLLVAE